MARTSPDEDEWQHKYSFITIPSFHSGQAYTVKRELDFRDVFEDMTLSSATLALDQVFTARPGIEWAQWGDVDGDLKGMRLDNRSDPMFNDKSREEEMEKLAQDLVLPFGAWSDDADDDGNEWVWLEVLVDDSPIKVEFQ